MTALSEETARELIEALERNTALLERRRRRDQRQHAADNEQLINGIYRSIDRRVFDTSELIGYAKSDDPTLWAILQTQGLDDAQKLGIRLGLLNTRGFVSETGLTVVRAGHDSTGALWAVEQNDAVTLPASSSSTLSTIGPRIRLIAQ